jgi:hypothetical protein
MPKHRKRLMDTITKSKIKSFFRGSRINKVIALTVVLAIGVSGYLFISTKAAGFFAATESDNGTLSGNVIAVNDSTASGGKAVQFNAPAPPPGGGGGGGGGATTTCPLPKYPDATCTGVPAGVVLSAYTGPTTITTANTIIDSKNITSCIDVNAPGVIIRKSRISCKGAPVGSFDGAYTGTALQIQDSEVDCQNTGGTAIGDTNYVAIRLNIHGCENGFDIDQLVTIQDSYIHDMYNSAAAHTDGIQFAGGHYRIVNGQYVKSGNNFVEDPNARDINILHNTIYSRGVDGSDGTSAIISNHGSDTNVLIQDNLMAGGAYTLYCDQGATGNNYRVINNHFSTIFHSTVAAYGPSDNCSDETLSGNVYHESGQPIHLD